MATSGVTGSSLPPGDDALIRRIQDLERVVRELGPGLMAAITPAINTLTTAVANINTIIGSEVYPLTSHADMTGMALATGANVEKLRTTITTPAGYTRAFVIATSTFSGVLNSTAARDEMYGITSINGTTVGWSTETSVPSGSTGTMSSTATTILTGLGSTFYVAAKASSGTNPWPAVSGFGAINIDVMAVFLR